MESFVKNKQYYKFSLYGFLKNLRFFDAFFILFLLEKGLSYTQIGVLYATREIFINIFEIPSGILADTYGRKKSLVLSLLSYMFSFLMFYFSTEFYMFFIAFILYGVGDAFRTGTHKGMIMDYLKLQGWEDKKIPYYGSTRSWSQKGSAISSLIAGAIVYFNESYSSVFLYSIVPYILNLLLIFSYPKELDKSLKISSNEGDFITKLKSLFNIIKSPKVLGIINASALHSAYLKAIKDYIQPVMLNIVIIIPFFIDSSMEKRNGIIFGIIFFLIYMITSYASKFSATLEAKKGSRIVFSSLILGFTLGAFAGLFYSIDYWVLSFLLFVGIYVVENIRKPILTGYIADNVPNDTLVSVISAQSLLKTIITSVIALSIGILTDYYGMGIALSVISILLIIPNVILKFASNMMH